MVSEVDDLGLGRLRRVANVRDIWSHEATAFTPWLAKHLDILGDELGTHLAVVATEAPVGEFRLDIQALDEQGRTVIIENQLEPSDHAHLGQLVVYASGVDASSPSGWLPGCGPSTAALWSRSTAAHHPA